MYNPDHTITYVARKPHPERLSAISKFAGNSILDVGCGNGAYVLNLPQYSITGVDYKTFAAWQAMPQKFSVSDASNLNQKDQSVDTIISFEVLEHLPQPKQALLEFYRVCRKNIIITVPNCELSPGMRQSNLIYHHWIDETHVNFFNLQTIAELVELVGFKITQRYYINRISPLPMVFEMFGWPKLAEKISSKLLLKLKLRKYYMTCLIVANK